MPIHMSTRASLVTPGRGRPRKYGRPSRALTLTLPEDVLTRLRALDTDLGRAIVTVVERSTKSQVRTIGPAELAHYGSHAVIVVTPVKALKRIPGVQLVPIGNGRCLISLEPLRSISQLELDIRDVLARSDASEAERKALEAIADILRGARVSRSTTLEERTIIVLESKRQRRSA